MVDVVLCCVRRFFSNMLWLMGIAMFSLMGVAEKSLSGISWRF
jgi:hypothetical protein